MQCTCHGCPPWHSFCAQLGTASQKNAAWLTYVIWNTCLKHCGAENEFKHCVLNHLDMKLATENAVKTNWSGYLTKGGTFSTMAEICNGIILWHGMAQIQSLLACHACCTHVNIWKALVALEAPMPLEQHTAEPTEAALSAKYTCELF